MIFQLCACALQKVPNGVGIYEIHDEWKTGRYVGSTINFRKRAHDHFRRLFKNVHPNRKLQNLFHRRKGILFFRIHVLTARASLKRHEQFMLDTGRFNCNRTKTAAFHAGRLCR